MNELCQWLHEQLEQLPVCKFPKLELLPENGIYFFYENGEIWGHRGNKLRIVRIGTHRDGNFRSRIKEHFLLNESKMGFGANKAKPSDRSIFRKNIGRAILNRDNDSYLGVWEIDFTIKKNRELYHHHRDIDKEKDVEYQITEILRENMSFRFIALDREIQRIGNLGLESSLVGTVANCGLCEPSSNWLGNHSPKEKIRESGLWLVQHLGSDGISRNDKAMILEAIKRTKEMFPV